MNRRIASFFDIAPRLVEELEKGSLNVQEAATQLGISRRSLYYLIDAGVLIRSGDISKEDAERLGWTKLQIILRHIAKREPDQSFADLPKFLSIAASSTVRDLPSRLQGREGEGTRGEVFHFTAEQQAFLRDALLKHGANLLPNGGLKGKEEALLSIIKNAVTAA